MPLNINFNCDVCNKRIDIQEEIIGTNPVQITITDLVFRNVSKDIVICQDCWPKVKKALTLATCSEQKSPSQSDSDASSLVQ